jgi:predicted TIM-barrel fold metal-dependent hydrolase
MTIDFRARPNTPEYISLYSGPAFALLWERFGYPEPPAVTLAQFLDVLKANGIDMGVFTGRQALKDGKLARGVTNDYVADCAKQSDGRLIGIAGIDPLAGEAAVAELERAVGQLGLRGVSLDPHNAKLMPHDKRMYPIYEKAAALGVPVVFTMGPLVGRWGDPYSVDVVAEDFPKLTIVCSHGCWPQVLDFVALGYRRPNVVLEASIYEFLPGAKPFLEAANSFLQDRVVYASAFPFNPIEIVHEFRKLGWSSAALEKITHKNAARILGL